MSLSRLARLIHELVVKIGSVPPSDQISSESSSSRIKHSSPLKTNDLRVDEFARCTDGDREIEREGRRKSARYDKLVHAPPSEKSKGSDAPTNANQEITCNVDRSGMGSMDSCKQYEFDEESVEDEYVLVSQHIRELQYHDLRFLKNHVSPV